MRIFTQGKQKCSNIISKTRSRYKGTKTRPGWHKALAVFICLCMIAGGLSVFTAFADADSYGAGSTDNVMERVADPDTTDSYVNALLNDTEGSRYAGRVWTDKTVFAFDADKDNDDAITLDKDTDGYEGDVEFNADFLHVFSALASSQLVNEYPPSPIDLVIALDMSASMAQDTRYDIDTSSSGGTYGTLSAEQRTMKERIKNSRIQQTLDAVNDTIDDLMEQNRNNRVAVVVYGAGAEVVLPLAHYKKKNGRPYLKVGGMETLYNLNDLEYDATYGWLWTRNVDAAYTIEADAMQSTDNNPGFEFNEEYTNSVSNNVKDEEYVKALPGYPEQTEALLKSDVGRNAKKELSARHYVGYFTNTQGGIFLAYEQLAKTKEVTYSEKLSTGVEATVARIPAAMIMTDGGANFAFNEMSNWDRFYGTYTEDSVGGYKPDETKDPPPYFRNDNSSYDPVTKTNEWVLGHDNIDFSHRVNEVNQTGDEWYNVYLPSRDGHEVTSLYNTGMVRKEGTLTTAPGWYHAGIFYSNDGTFGGATAAFATQGVIMQTTMTAAYMKTAVDKHYSRGWDEANATTGNRTEVSTYTVSVDSDHVPQWGRLRLYPSLDPANYLFKDDKWNSSELLANAGDAVAIDPGTYTEAFKTVVNYLEQWKGGAEEVAPLIDANRDTTVKIKRINDEDGAGYTDSRYDVKLTNDEVANNIIYNDGFYDVSTSGLSGVFDNILSLITGSVFVPITGDNDAGVSDSITYQDPIGEYMEVKSQSVKTKVHAPGEENKEIAAKAYDMSLLSFGKMHGLVRAGVYDYQWNDTRMKSTNPGSAGETPLPMGWYKGEATDPSVEGVNFVPAAKGYPDGCEKPEDAWGAGWTFRLDYKTIMQYVPIANSEGVTKPGEMPEQIRNTTYTVYRFAGSEADRNELHLNPIYETAENGGKVPQEALNEYKAACKYEGGYTSDMALTDDKWQDHVTSYPDNDDSYKDYPGVYRMSDIRVWVEEYGDYKDEAGSITPNSNAYDASVYVNVPVAAIPTQLAEITLGKSGVLSYKSNVDDQSRKDECTPIRLFYTVGLDEDLLINDAEGSGHKVNISALSEEYVAEHSDTSTGSIWFISNYYSNTSYDGYIDDQSRTRGDPAVSFSPGADNRYYVFQKPLPLYAHAYRVNGNTLTAVDRSDNEMWTKDDNKTGGNGETTWEGGVKGGSSWNGGMYMGVYDDEAQFKTRLSSAEKNDEMITDANGEKYEVTKDGIVFLKQDLMDHVQSDDTGKYTDGSVSFNSDDYFFIIVEYYLPDTTKTGVDRDGNKVPNSYGGKAVKRVVARIGSAFGSGFNSDNINNGDMLCWTDMNGDIDLQFEYFSRTVTGDNTRGEPTYEKLFAERDDLETYLEKECGVSREKRVPAPTAEEPDKTVTALDQQVDYWMNVRTDQKVDIFINRIKDKAKTDYSGNDKAAFNAMANWAVATRTGGIRTGDMANNRRQKTANPTSTAGNFYIPTVSDNSGVGNDVMINNFLGNNGRLKVANNQLLATKLLEAPKGFSLTSKQEKESFLYQIFVAGLTGEVDATKVHYNPFSKTWQRQLAYIDVLTDNSSLILDTNSNRALFAYDDNGGNPTARQVVQEDGKYYYANGNGTANTSQELKGGKSELYYMYLPSKGGGGTDMSRRLYQDPDYDVDGADDYNGDSSAKKDNRLTIYCTNPDEQVEDKVNHIQYDKATEDHPVGTFAYWAADTELIPISEVEKVEQIDALALESADGDRWDHETSERGNHKHLDYYTIVASRPESDTSESNIASPFKTRTQYMTKRLTFGGKDPKDLYDQIIPKGDRPDLFGSFSNEYIADHTAEFTLKSGEGLLLTGLENRVAYRFTEKLTVTQKNQGYELKELDHTQQVGSKNIYRPGVQTIPVYTKAGATYGDCYKPYQNAETENDLTWKFDQYGKENTTAKVSDEPFNHSNAVIWEYYATMGANEVGNHHHRTDSGSETATFFNKSVETKDTHTVLTNPSCATCDEPVYEDGKLVSYLHYMYKEGKPVDFHYEGEASAYLRNMSRFLVSTTAHFGVENETQTSAESAPPVTGSTNYTGVYSTFGNTGYFEEQSHFINTFEPNDISITKELGTEKDAALNKYDKNTEFDFTLTLAKGTGETSFVLPDILDYSVTDEKGSVVKEGRLISKGSSETAKDNDIKAEEEGVWKFKIKAGQTMRVKRLPVGTSYTYKVVEEKYPDGYTTNGNLAGTPPKAGNEVSGNVTSGYSGPVKIFFTNVKKAPTATTAGFALTKTVKDETEPDKGDYELKAEDFSFIVTPSSTNPADDPIRKIAWDKDKQTGWNDKTGTLTVKNGEAEELDPPDPTGRTEKAKAQVLPDSTAFDKAGTYVYTVREEIPNTGKPGITYTAKTYKVTIEVEEDYGENPEKDPVYTGKLKATVTITDLSKDTPETATEFTNTFDKNKVSVILQAKKLLKAQDGSDVPFNPDDYEFRLTRVETDDEDGGSPAEINRNADGSDVKASSEATEPSGTTEKKAQAETESTEPRETNLDPQEGSGTSGEHDIAENKSTEANSKSGDENKEGITGDGASGEAENGTNEINSIAGESGSPGSLLKSADEEDYMPEGDGDKAKNDIDGWAYFGPITYKDVGTYEYEITEKKGLKTGVEYDEAVYHVTVKVTRDEETEALQASVTYTRHEKDEPDGAGTAAETAEFTNNIITGALEVDKKVTGKGGDQQKAFTFRITLTDAVGNVLDEVNGKYGDMDFTKGIAGFTLKHGDSRLAKNLPVDAHYTVEESDYSGEGYTTTAEGEVGVIVKDETEKAAFTNDKPNKDKPKNPNGSSGTNGSDGNGTQTGDDSNVLLWLILATASAAGMAAIGVITLRGRRRN